MKHERGIDRRPYRGEALEVELRFAFVMTMGRAYGDGHRVHARLFHIAGRLVGPREIGDDGFCVFVIVAHPDVADLALDADTRRMRRLHDAPALAHVLVERKRGRVEHHVGVTRFNAFGALLEGLTVIERDCNRHSRIGRQFAHHRSDRPRRQEQRTENDRRILVLRRFHYRKQPVKIVEIELADRVAVALAGFEQRYHRSQWHCLSPDNLISVNREAPLCGIRHKT